MASGEPSLCRIGEQLNACALIRDRIEKEINNDPPSLVNKGGIIAKGVNEELMTCVPSLIPARIIC